MQEAEVLGRIIAMFDVSMREIIAHGHKSDDPKVWKKSLDHIALIARMQEMVFDRGINGIDIMLDIWTKEMAHHPDLEEQTKGMMEALQKVSRTAKAAIH